MQTLVRYALAAAAGLAVAGALAAVATPSPVLLVGVVESYAVAVALSLAHPDVLWGREYGGAASAVFAGATTFGVLSLAEGLGVDFNLGAAVLGFGLAWTGLAAGVAMVRRA
ncbi:MAG: hypothetical protein ABEJ70_06845 [Halobacteriaceae archaeon]